MTIAITRIAAILKALHAEDLSLNAILGCSQILELILFEDIMEVITMNGNEFTIQLTPTWVANAG